MVNNDSYEKYDGDMGWEWAAVGIGMALIPGGFIWTTAGLGLAGVAGWDDWTSTNAKEDCIDGCYSKSDGTAHFEQHGGLEALFEGDFLEHECE